MSIQLKLKPIIGVDARPLSYGYTGNSRYLIEALKYLVRKDSHFEYRLYTNKEIHPVFLPILKELNLNIPSIKKIPGILWLNFFLPGILSSDRVDIFWGTLQLLPLFKLPLPTVVNYHDLNFISAPQTMSFLNFLQHKFLSSFTLAHADRIFCLSENTKKEISNFKPDVSDKLTVIYPGANRITEKENDLDIGDFILTLSTIEPRKNLQTLIDGYIEVVRQNPNYPNKLVIAGRIGWGEESLVNSLKNGFYSNKGILFIENPDEGTLAFLLRNCKFFLFPSKHEGFGLPIIEAMIEGKLCITSDIPVFREIIEPNFDLLAETMNSNSWAEKILEMTQRISKIQSRNLRNGKWSWITTGKLIETEITDVWDSYIKVKTMSHAI